MQLTATDGRLRALLVALGLDTALAMVLSLTRLVGQGPTAGFGAVDGMRAVVTVIWFVLALLVFWRVMWQMRRLGRLVSSREDKFAAVEATSREWLWEATAIADPELDIVTTSCNQAISQLLGRELDEIIGVSIFELLVEEDCAAARAIIERAVVERTGWQDVALRWKHREGHTVELVGSAVPVVDSRGTVTGFRGMRGRAAPDAHVAHRREMVRSRLLEVMQRNEFEIALQPIVNLGSGQWAGVEALARFGDSRGPSEWFAEAQDAGLGLELELAALCAALRLAGHLPKEIYLSVNASPALIVDHRFSAALRDGGVDLERLTVEITEHTAISCYEDVSEALRPLREEGLRLAVDDTGAGYASFTHVVNLQPDVIKLDRSLVTNIDADRARRAVVVAMMLLALELGATVTAEGIETEAELSSLTHLGVDHGQGYVLGPASADPSCWKQWIDRVWVPEP